MRGDQIMGNCNHNNGIFEDIVDLIIILIVLEFLCGVINNDHC
jgi:hypothetical protein